MTTRELILGTAGHIDHGKTALVRALTGIDTDRLEQEKERGISIDLGFAHLDLDGTRLGIVDVPGHERFIRNMLAGAAGIDLAMLVVAADDSVMPQTREHLAILRMLQVARGLVVLTKCDLAEPSWLDLVEEDVRSLVAGTFLEDAPIVRTSATTGAGLDDLRVAVAKLVTTTTTPRTDGPFRLDVDRAFTLKGLGTVVTGTVWSGVVDVGAEVSWLPVDRPVRIRGIESHHETTDRVGRGRRAALNLTGAHHAEIERGHVLATPGSLAPSRRITVRLSVLDESPWPVRHRGRVRLYLGTQEVMAEIRLLDGLEIAPGGDGLAVLHAAEPVCAVARQPFVVRLESPLRTIGGGVVLQPTARGVSRRRPEITRLLAGLERAPAAERIDLAVRLRDDEPWSEADLCREADVTAAELREVLPALEEAGAIRTVSLGPTRTGRIHADALGAVAARVTDAVRRLHDETPLLSAVPRERVASRLGWLDPVLVQGVIDSMRADGALRGDEQAVALPDFRPKLTGAQRALRERLLAEIEAGGFRPPAPSGVAESARVPAAQLREILDLCVGAGELTALGGDLYLHAKWERELRARITASLRDSPGMTVSEIKDVLGTSRKYAVPICEYLDRIGLTERRDDRRALAADAP